MKAFVLFHGPGRYPVTALASRLGSFDTLLEAEQFIEHRLRSDEGNWAQVRDSVSHKVLRSGRQDGPGSAYWWTWRNGLQRY